MYFRYFVIISAWKRAGPFIWTNLNPIYPRMLCAKFGWNWPSGSGKEDENVKSLQTDGQTDQQTEGPTDNGRQVIRKAHLSFQLRWAKNHINLTLLSKVNVVSESWMCPTLHIIIIHPCSKYGMPMSNQEKVRGRTRICTDTQTDSTDKVIPIYSLELCLKGV